MQVEVAPIPALAELLIDLGTSTRLRTELASQRPLAALRRAEQTATATLATAAMDFLISDGSQCSQEFLVLDCT